MYTRYVVLHARLVTSIATRRRFPTAVKFIQLCIRYRTTIPPVILAGRSSVYVVCDRNDLLPWLYPKPYNVRYLTIVTS